MFFICSVKRLWLGHGQSTSRAAGSCGGSVPHPRSDLRGESKDGTGVLGGCLPGVPRDGVRGAADPVRGMPSLQLSYKGTLLRQTYSPDFICFESIIVELKAGRDLAPEHRAQILNYLRATGLKV